MSEDTYPEERLVGHLTALVERIEMIAARLAVAEKAASPTAAYMTVNDAAAHFNVSRSTLFRNRQFLVRFAGCTRVDAEKLRAHLETS